MEIATAPEPIGRDAVKALDQAFKGEPRVGFELRSPNGLLLGERLDGRDGDMRFSLTANGEVLDFTVRMNGTIRIDGRQRDELPTPAEIVSAVLSGDAVRLPDSITAERLRENEELTLGLRSHLKGFLDRRQVAAMLENPENVTDTYGGEIFPDTGLVMGSEETYRISGRHFDLVLEAGAMDIGTDSLDLSIASVIPPTLDSIDRDDLPYEIDMMDFVIRAVPTEILPGEEGAEHVAVQPTPGSWRIEGLDAGRSYRFEVKAPEDAEE